jgi:Leucine-rich repeat (LRR) protein
MKRLPSRFGTLVNLEVFSFGCLEQLQELPEEIGNLRKLEELIIDNGNGCSMSVMLPRSIGKLENLRVLRLYGALEVDSNQPVRLRKTKILPDTIADLRKLEVLDLGRNGLEAVPPQIAALTNLKTLRLEYNSLRAVPEFVGAFKNLKELSLDANGKLSNLPASLANLSGLKVSMGNNSLKLRDQKSLRSRFPKIVFSFEDEYDDAAANEKPAKPKSKSRRKQ